MGAGTRGTHHAEAVVRTYREQAMAAQGISGGQMASRVSGEMTGAAVSAMEVSRGNSRVWGWIGWESLLG